MYTNLLLHKELSFGLIANIAGHRMFSEFFRVDRHFDSISVNTQNGTLHKYAAQSDRILRGISA